MIGFWIFIIFISFVFAKVEINIEGKDGWAKNLPTWRIKNRITYLFYGDSPLTGYHFWMIVLLLSFLHFPFFFYQSWSLHLELRALSGFFFISLFEDFFWFLLNPKYGIKKFNRNEIPWHTQWFAGIPFLYYKVTVMGSILLILSYLANSL